MENRRHKLRQYYRKSLSIKSATLTNHRGTNQLNLSHETQPNNT